MNEHSQKPELAPLLKIEQLSFAYHLPNGKQIAALRHLNLQVPRGAIMGLIGESGCGKTTLCNLLTLSLGYQYGQIYLQGQEIRSLVGQKEANKSSLWSQLFGRKKLQTATAAHAVGAASAAGATSAALTADPQLLRSYYSRVQYVFQDPKSAMPPHLPVKTFACAPLINLKHYSREQALEAVNEMLLQVGLSVDCLQRYPHELSIGQLQRINLVKSLIIEPELLLCDEITSALDEESAERCLALLRQYQSHGGTVLFITHDLGLAPKICSHFALMFKGSILEQWQGTEKPLHPYAQQLQQAQDILAQKAELSSWQDPMVLSCPVSIDLLCPFLLRCSQAHEPCLQQAPTWHQLNAQHKICCHLKA
ncbi:MAG TPA: ATP-binding cassette domain-containing protein [Candidatus Anaerobiospirillum pullistercoris]|uniref:ATP-binding cassette domain-containing protein n=1 Tax=Candidatus Anaerobiospirillum pullistercoris TaxID=2838452 RepID=A0A9D1WBM3_9GAMM|nr:ATP-binding cassette domain-containing protein [Candidatus Anaerobiospirillum pullistercoris]